MKDGLSLRTNSHKNLEDMSEAECNKCLSTKAYVMNDDIRLPTEAAVDKSLSGLKSKTVILPLSLENKTPTQALTPPAEKIDKSLTYV